MSLSNHIVNDRLIFGGFSSKQDYFKLIGIWQSISNKKGKALSTEMVDYIRSKQTVVDSLELGAFPTLDISSCNLEDETALCLVEALAMRPSIAKLDLTDCEVSHKLVDVLLRLLRGQTKLVRSVDLDDRLQLALLGEVAMAVESSSDVTADHDAFQELSLLSNALNFANAQVLIRSLYKRKKLVEPVFAAHVHLIWTQLMGDIVQEELENAYAAASLFEHVHSALNYTEMEAMLLCGLIDRGVLAVLNEWQMSAIGFSPQWLQHYHQRAVETVLSSYSRTTTITASQRSPRTPCSVPMSVPVVQVDIPEVELNSSLDCEEGVQEVDVVEEVIAEALHSLQRSGSRRSISTDNTPSPAVVSATPPITPTTASLFTAKYLQRSMRAEKKASTSLASPTSSSKPAMRRLRSSVLAVPSTQPPMRSPAQVSGQTQQEHGESLTSVASPASTVINPDPSELLYIRYDKIKALQQGRGDTLPHLSPLLAPHLPYEYRDGASTAIDESMGSAPHFTPRDGDSMEGDDVSSMGLNYYSTQPYPAAEHRRYSFTGSEGDILPPSPPVQSAFALDLQAFSQAPGKLNVLTVCNVSHTDAELANLLGWPENRRHPVTVLILRNNGIVYAEHLNLTARFENLLDLDLSFNHIAGTVKGLPRSLQRLDLSHNRISNIASLADCVGLVELNLAHNNVKSFHALPPRLECFDLSHNVITSAVTLRTLALSPDIKSLNLTGNPVLIEMTDWKVVVLALLPRLHELNGKPLFVPKKSTERRPAAPPKQSTRRPSPAKQPVPPRPSSRSRRVSAREQLVNDAVRMHSDMSKYEVLEEARREYADRFRNRSTVLRPHEVQQLTKRLTAPTKAFKLRSSAIFSPPRLFTEKDLIHRRYPPSNNRGNSSQRRSNRTNTDYVTTQSTRRSPSSERERVNFYSDPAYYTGNFQDKNEAVSSEYAREEVAETLQSDLPAVTELVLNGTDSSAASDWNAGGGGGLLLPPPVPTHHNKDIVPRLDGFLPIPPRVSQYESTLATAAVTMDSGRREDISQNSLGSAAMSVRSSSTGTVYGASATPSPMIAKLGSYASAASMVSVNPSELSESDQVYQDDTADAADQLQHTLCLEEDVPHTASLSPVPQNTQTTSTAATLIAPTLKETEQSVRLPETLTVMSEAGEDDTAVVVKDAPQGIAETSMREQLTLGTQPLARISSSVSSLQGGGDSEAVLVGDERSCVSLSTAADPPSSRASANPTPTPRPAAAPLSIITTEAELHPQRVIASDSPLLNAVTSPLTEPEQATPMSRAGSVLSTDFTEDGSAKLSAKERLKARLAKNKK